MKKTVLKFGLIAGAVSAALMLATIPFMHRLGDYGVVVGYAGIVLSFLFVFFGIRSYREEHGGTVTFGRALSVGLLIALIGSLCYVLTWEVVSPWLAPNFVDEYAAHTIARMKAAGATAAAIEETSRQMAAFKVQYANPLFRTPMVFLEPFPVGVLVALISAAVLRRRGAPTT